MQALSTHEFRALFLAGGLGAGARGFVQARAVVGKHAAKFINLGGIDIDRAGLADFEKLADGPGIYGDIHTLQPEDLLRITGPRRPDVVFSSTPCKGLSRLLGADAAALEKYQALNRLTLEAFHLVCTTYADDPVPLLILENVPGIMELVPNEVRGIVARLRADLAAANEAKEREARHHVEAANARDEWRARAGTAEALANRLATDALVALAGTVPTPVEGYVAAPYLLGKDIGRLVTMHDAKAAVLRKWSAKLSWWHCGENCAHEHCDAGCDLGEGCESNAAQDGQTPPPHEDDCPCAIVAEFDAALDGSTAVLDDMIERRNTAESRAREAEERLAAVTRERDAYREQSEARDRYRQMEHEAGVSHCERADRAEAALAQANERAAGLEAALRQARAAGENAVAQAGLCAIHIGTERQQAWLRSDVDREWRPGREAIDAALSGPSPLDAVRAEARRCADCDTKEHDGTAVYDCDRCGRLVCTVHSENGKGSAVYCEGCTDQLRALADANQGGRS